MPQALGNFLSNVEYLQSHLQFEKESQLFFRNGMHKYTGDSNFETEFRNLLAAFTERSLLRSKVYTYQNTIISLYGYLERYIEDCIVEYLRNISDVCPKFDLLPASIKKYHLELSLEYINKLRKSRGWSNEERKQKILESVDAMNEFLRESGVHKINYSAFINHYSNFRYDTIHEIFYRVGIENISRICLNDSNVVLALCEKHGVEVYSDKKVLISVLTADLDDLAHRRNEIAHGVRVDDIESVEIMISRIKLIKVYVQAIDQIIANSLWQFIFNVSSSLALGIASKIFPKLNVIGFETVLSKTGDKIDRIGVGDYLFAVNQGSKVGNISGEILSLYLNKKSVNEIDLPSVVY